MRIDGLFHNAWLLIVATSIPLAVVCRAKLREAFPADDALRAKGERLLYGFLVWNCLPWLILGLGIHMGWINSLFDIFQGSRGGPFVGAWFLGVGLLLALGLAWLMWGGGAGSLSQIGLAFHPIFTARNIRWMGMAAMAWNLLIGSLIYWNILDFTGFQQISRP